MARLRKRNEEEIDLDRLRQDVDGWWSIKAQSKLIAKHLSESRDTLMKIVQRYGVIDPTSGSIFLDLDQPVSERKIVKLKAQRSVTNGFNSDAAEQILRGKGLWDEMVEMIPQLDSGKVHAAFYDNKITEDELARMFPQSISFSFILLDDNDKPVS